MQKKKKSLKSKLLRYNLLLISILVFVCGMYIMINDRTLKKYNATYTAYNQLNKFYTNAKLMNDSYKSYLYNPSEDNYQLFLASQKESYQNLERIEESLENPDIEWRFISLRNMLDAYREQADLVKQENSAASSMFAQEYDKLNVIYDLMNKTNGDSYGYLTTDMQKQKKEVTRSQQYVSLFTIFLLLYVVIWMMYFSISTIRSLSDPIEKIIKNMNRIKKGEYDLTQISNANLEMNELCLALEDMAERVQENITYANEKADLEKRVLEQQNENLKKDELLAQSELKVLQNQINPHFLFNTLNLIYKMAYSEGAAQTSELMEKTSQLLRYGLDSANKISDLKSELTAIKNYMYIQEKRYGSRFSFILDIEPSVPNIKMPSMILQPLVENAVAHGLRDVVEDGEVLVEVMQQGHEEVIVVSDNGVGMMPDQVEALVLNDFRISNDDRSHLGLYNVTKRLKAFFGDKVKILVDSSLDCGFVITIRIQLEDGEIYVFDTCD